jgi:hypothetical protein
MRMKMMKLNRYVILAFICTLCLFSMALTAPDTVIPKIQYSLTDFPVTSPKILDGGGNTILYGFEEPYKPFDPANPPKRIWGGMNIMDCQNMLIKGYDIMGGIDNTLSLNDSYPEDHELAYITFEDCNISLAETRGLFVAGKRIHDITFRDCTFLDCIYSGNGTHGGYVSGGAWDPKYPPIKNIWFDRCTFAFTGGRHGLQFNGRFDGIKLTYCNFYHNQLSGLSLIGCRNVEISHCLFWGNGRSPIVIYDDPFDSSYWNPNFHSPDNLYAVDDQGKFSFEHWMAIHHPNGNIHISYCTLYVGPTPWIKDPYHFNDPQQFPCIMVNNAVNGKIFGGQIVNYPPGRLEVDHCILVTQKSNQIVEFYNCPEALQSFFHDNIMWSTNGQPGVQTPVGFYTIDYIQTIMKPKEGYYLRNVIKNPGINIPAYPLIDRSKQPYFDWSTRHEAAASVKAHANRRLDLIYGRYGLQLQARQK